MEGIVDVEVRNSLGVSSPFSFSILADGASVGFTFREQTISNYTPQAQSVRAADFNRDGFFDLVAGGVTSAVYLNDKTGKITNKVALATAGQTRSIETADLDGDGKLIHTQNSVYLEKDKNYGEKLVNDFLKQWSPKALHPAV